MNIDCQYVRQLVRTKQNQSGSLEQLFTDHHLANCADCRAALDIPSPTLLGSLLDTQTPPLPASHPLYQQVPQRRKPANNPRKPAQPQPAPEPAKPVRRQPQPAPEPAKPVRRQPQPAPEPAKPVRRQVRHAVPSEWSWRHFVVITVVTVVVSYGVVLGVRAGWNMVRIWQGLGIISQPTPAATVPDTTQLTPSVIAETIATPTAIPAQIVLPAGSDQPLTVLLLGSDRRPHEKTTSRTDTVMLMRVDPKTQKMSLLSFPRDLMVNIPGYGWARINAAHVYGDLYPELGGGNRLATQTVSNLIGQPIDYTVLVDFEGFINIVNALGGVSVSVPKELYDAQFPTMDYKYREVYFAVGQTVMDGETALTYSRIRHPDNDFERTTRQQSVVLGIGQRLQSDGYLATLDKVAAITDALIGHAQTDMPRELIVALAWQMREMNTAQITRYTFRDIYYGTGENRYAMYAVDGAIQRIVTQWLAQ